jgi:hypothetical protein
VERSTWQSEAVKEVDFIFFFLRDMGILDKFPVMVRTDNIGAMFMAENASSGIRTRHIDTRYHFIRGHVDDVFINNAFVKTDENDSYMFTKNFNKDTYKRYLVKFLGKIEG